MAFKLWTRLTALSLLFLLVLGSSPLGLQKANGAEKREVGMSAGDSFSIVLQSDGTVWGWGSNAVGQLATGQISKKASVLPIQIKGIKSINKIVAGGSHAFAMANGKVWGWGLNHAGQVGNDSRAEYIMQPTLIPQLKDVVSISGGNSYNLALTKKGAVLAWGDNTAGQLGTGNNKLSREPVEVPGLTHVVSIYAGYKTSYAIRDDGTLWAWGDNSGYQLADGTKTNRNKPVQVKGISSVQQVASGSSPHTVVLKKDGTVWTWGVNGSGQLGNGGVSADRVQKSPARVQGISGVVKVVASKSNTLALTKNGAVYIWGGNEIGQSGGGKSSRTTPYHFPGLTGVVDVAASSSRSFYALDTNGYLWAWGDDVNGMIGNGKETIIDPKNPAKIITNHNQTSAYRVMKL
jgi:alpha-tubulin suppressor-like RCC1 family protein